MLYDFRNSQVFEQENVIRDVVCMKIGLLGGVGLVVWVLRLESRYPLLNFVFRNLSLFFREQGGVQGERDGHPSWAAPGFLKI